MTLVCCRSFSRAQPDRKELYGGEGQEFHAPLFLFSIRVLLFKAVTPLLLAAL